MNKKKYLSYIILALFAFLALSCKNKNVEVLEENETNLLDNNYSDEAIISIEDDSKNFKSVKSDNARGKGRVPASHDDEPMKF